MHSPVAAATSRYKPRMAIRRPVYIAPVMFALVITLISIALVTALALATIYYGGSAFRQGSDAAAAAQLINSGQQVNAAVTLASANSLTVSTPSQLVPTYLTTLPSGAGWAFMGGGVVRLGGMTTALCQAVNVKAGIKAADTASATDTDSALTVTLADLNSLGKTYGCPTAPVRFFFRMNQ